MLPVPAKTWQFAHIANDQTGSVVGDMNDFQLKILAAAKAFPSHPLVCVGSSDGVTSNMTGTDLWTSPTALVRNVAGTPHSWWVGSLAGIAAGAQVCFDLCMGSPDYESNIMVSPTGFSGGSTTARPTATDESTLFDYHGIKQWFGRIGNDEGTGDKLYGHIMLSTDGTCFRVLVMNNGTLGGFLIIDKPANPQPGDDPISARVAVRWSNTITDFWDRQLLGSEGAIGSSPVAWGWPFLELRDGPNEISGEYPLQQAYFHDLWFTTASLREGSTFPADNTKQFIALGGAVFVCDGTDWERG